MSRLLLVMFALSVLLVAAALVALALYGGKGGTEGFFDENPYEEPLTASGQIHGDPMQCTVWPYSFASEGLVAHPGSTAAAPKCILVRDGVGLLASSDTTACQPTADQTDLHWQNPLAQAGNGGAIASLFADHVAGLDRCTVAFAPDATAEDLAAVDAAMTLAGAEVRSGLPLVLRQLEVTTASLDATTASLDGASSQIGADSGRMLGDASTLAACQDDIRVGEAQLEQLAQDNARAMLDSTRSFERQYADLQTTSEQRFTSRVAQDQADLYASVERQKVIDAQVCADRIAAQVKADAEKCAGRLKSAATEQKTKDDIECAAQLQPLQAQVANQKCPAAGPCGSASLANGLVHSAVRDNYCVDVQGVSRSQGAQVYVWDCLNADNQKWTLDDQRRLVSTNSKMCMDVYQGATGNGSGIVQWPCGPQANQKWTYNPADRSLKPDHAPGMCLDVDNGKTANGTKLQIYTCNGSSAQKFTMG